MAYKFSLGTYRHSGSMVAEEGITVDSGGLTVTTGSVSLPAGEINTAELADAAVTAIKLAADAVETAKIKDANVTTAKLADAAVTNAKLQNNSVSFNGVSVALGASGSFTTTAVAEGDNLYFTQTRARQSLSVADTNSIDMTYASGSGEFQAALRLSGSGLQVTADGLRIAADAAGDGLAWADGVLSVNASELIGDLGSVIDAHLSGGTGIAYSNGTASIAFSEFDSDDVVEGTSNLFFTDARARAAVSAANGAASDSGSLAYNSTTGVFTLSPASPTWAKGLFSATDTNSIDMGYDSATGAFSGSLRVSGSGLQVTADGLRIAALAAGGGLGWNDGALDVLTTGAVTLKNDRVAITASVAGDGLGFIASGLGDLSQLKVNVDASSIEIDSDALRVKALGITNTMLSGGIENAKLLNSSVTVTAGAGLTTGGSVSLGGSVTLDVASANGGIVVNANDIELKLATTGALNIGASGLDLKTIISGERTFSDKVTINGDLVVLGSTFSASVGTLLIEDSNIVVGDGSTSFATDYGMTFGNGWATLQTAQANIDGVAGVENLLSSSLALKAPAIAANTFYGALVGTTQESIQLASGSATAEQAVVLCDASGGAFTLTLPAASDWSGKFIKVKKSEGSAFGVTIDGNASETIDGVPSIVLESPYAAVMLVSNGSNWFVF